MTTARIRKCQNPAWLAEGYRYEAIRTSCAWSRDERGLTRDGAYHNQSSGALEAWLPVHPDNHPELYARCLRELDGEIWAPCPAPTGVGMITPPECAGQIVEESYSARAHDGVVYRRFRDRSDRSERWERADADDFEEWDPAARCPTIFS